ncbi:Nidogen-2 [Folsomia candida]|uniref:Nidogen-2 n=1 Tax=Folsomia candida TaxID=158441 RepID=A0A226DEN2_FOLCA|nr:Nidogen-2 [Folsomia candida]
MERIQQSRRNGFATMVVGVWSLTAVLLVTLLASPTTALSLNRDTPTPTTNSSSSGVTKGGRCPDAKMDQRLCSEGGDQCTHDAQCSGESLCCSTGCGRVCVIPVFTACEQVRSFAERRARSLEPEDAASVPLPDCDPETGKFQEVQCSAAKGGCFCVDSQGFELPGTRAATREQVNCSRRNPKCEGPTCRMLCPHGFALDSDGCETCECLNFCSKVKCPSGEECEVVEPPCSTSPCPPVPSCKQPRSLDSLCPFGAPLTIPELGSPFLCGSGPSGPPCPAAFQCNVGAGNDYGVCCAANKNFDKPGTCPVVGVTLDNKDDQEEADKACPAGCRHDLDCPDFDKCCFTQGCGKQCSKPANTTACLQQKHIAELLSGRELEGKGYIPQCDESGTFLPKQCSRNGKVCWCVGPDGKNFAQSLGSAESVNCSTLSTTTSRHRAGAPRSDDSSYVTSACDPIICPPNLSCEYGFKTDRNSCPTCDCMESPCAHLRCPSGSGCVLVKSERGGEALEPTCLSDSLFVNPCPLGSPLTYAQSAQVVACSQSAPTCPSSHICVLVAPNKAGLCCPNSPRLEPTKPGMCPFLAPTLCSGSTTSTANNSLELVQSHKKCGSDSDCNTSMKCCAAGDCTVCADPLLHQDIPHTKSNTPSMCQYLRDVDTHTPLLGKFRMAKSKPQCKENGEFSEIQCDQDHCACVDEHGAEIPGTMMDKLSHNLTTKACLAARHNPKCLEMNCRLECDYGYERVDTCKICECKNPCLSKHNCGEDDQCEMVDIDCVEDHCPPLPFCVPKVLAALANGEALSPGGGNAVVSPCPGGRAPFRSSDSNDSALSCSPRARMLQCPDGQCPSSHICVLVAPKKLGMHLSILRLLN